MSRSRAAFEGLEAPAKSSLTGGTVSASNCVLGEPNIEPNCPVCYRSARRNRSPSVCAGGKVLHPLSASKAKLAVPADQKNPLPFFPDTELREHVGRFIPRYRKGDQNCT